MTRGEGGVNMNFFKKNQKPKNLNQECQKPRKTTETKPNSLIGLLLWLLLSVLLVWAFVMISFFLFFVFCFSFDYIVFTF